MSTVTGTIEAMSGKSAYGTYGILVDGTWYNSKFPISANKGDEVEFDNGGKKYVNKLKVVSAGAGGETAPKTTPRSTGGYSRGKFPVAKDDGQIAIIRQNALTNACNLFTETMEVGTQIDDETVATIIGIARTFESYTSGDVDREAAKRMEFDPE